MNRCDDTIKVRIYPVGTFFHPVNEFNTYMEYSPLLSPGNTTSENRFITGGEKDIIPYSTELIGDDRLKAYFRINHDGTWNSRDIDITVGYGKYKIDIFYDSSNGQGWKIIKSFTMDWSDFDYYNNYPNIFSVSSADVQVQVYSSDSIKVNW